MTDTPAMLVLLLEDNPADAALIRDHLRQARQSLFDVWHADRLGTAIIRLTKSPPEALLVDLTLPDSHGIATFRQLHLRWPQLPIVVLTGVENEALGLQAVREGAQDFLDKNEVTSTLLEKSLLYAIARKRTESSLQEQTRLLQSILTSLADGVVVVDESGFCVQINPAAEAILGFRPHESIPHHEWPRQYETMFARDGRTLHPADELPLSQVRNGRPVKDHELICRHPMATEGLIVSVNAAPLKDDRGRIRGGVEVLRDVTESRRQTEKIGILNHELEQRIQERNQEFEAFGYKVSKDVRPPLKKLETELLLLKQDAGRKLGDRGLDSMKTLLATTAILDRLVQALCELTRTPRSELRTKLGLGPEGPIT